MDNEQMRNNGASNEVPIFTPPTPTFTPPSDASSSFDAHACHYHHDELAIEECARCGKNICEDCYDNYGVASGDYAGEALCYDCCHELVADNIEELKENKGTIKRQFIFSIIGMSIGFIYGFVLGIKSGGFGSALLTGIILAGVGGVFLSAMKAFFSLALEAIGIAFQGRFGLITILSLLFNIVVIVFKCIWVTVSNTFFYINYLKETSGFIESDTAALQEMDDYMEYTLIRNKNRGVDIDTLLSQESELSDNSYAHMVQQNGEEGAEAHMRDVVATINENGEIIRSFNTRAA